MKENKSELEKLVLKLFQAENEIMHDYFKKDLDKDLDVYKNLYIENCEYLQKQSGVNSDCYKRYLALYTTNQMYENYKKNKKRND